MNLQPVFYGWCTFQTNAIFVFESDLVSIVVHCFVCVCVVVVILFKISVLCDWRDWVVLQHKYASTISFKCICILRNRFDNIYDPFNQNSSIVTEMNTEKKKKKNKPHNTTQFSHIHSKNTEITSGKEGEKKASSKLKWKYL